MAETNTFAKEDDFANGKWYTNIRRIKGFPALMLSHQLGHRNEFFRSKLSVDDHQECTLTLVLYPGGYDDDHSDFVAVRASLDRAIQRKAIVDVSICGRDNEEHFRRRVVLTKANYDRAIVKDFVGKSALLNIADLLHNNDQLKILFRVCFENEENEIASSASRSLARLRHAQMDNYEKLFDNGDFSDFELIVGDTTFNVHKCILATHSPVFAAMFCTDMSEKTQASTKIEDVDAETMRELLRFIYITKVEKLDQFACKFWIAADKYNVERLKEVCEEKLIEKLGIDSLVETLCFLDKYNACKLKMAAIQVIISNVETISDDGKFKSTLKTLSSDLLSEILLIMCNWLKRTKEESLQKLQIDV